ncbi:MAG: biopolymer transporter ExbD [Deltaproteobacteria bacterium]|nr:biopolymer transporter ExbD [Deltaproteobacteria bacterium]
MAGTNAGRGPIVGINVTPMVDVVLVLLVIMMVSATYIVAQSLKVELPKSSTSDESTPTLAVVTITKEKTLLFNEQPVTENDLKQKLEGVYAKDNDVSLVVSADQEAYHGNVVHVIDLAKLIGITKFAINVERN